MKEVNNFTGIVLAHGRAMPVAGRHLASWGRWCDEIVYVCPDDDPVPSVCGERHLCGRSRHHGPDNVARQQLACVLAGLRERAMVLEYDTLLFGPPPEPLPGVILTSVVFGNVDPRFRAPEFSHSPWICTPEDWRALAKIRADGEAGFPDRWMGFAAMRAGLRFGALPWSYSANTIDTDQKLAEACSMLRHAGAGASFAVHGVKTQEVFHALEEAWKLNPNTGNRGT